MKKSRTAAVFTCGLVIGAIAREIFAVKQALKVNAIRKTVGEILANKIFEMVYGSSTEGQAPQNADSTVTYYSTAQGDDE